MRLPLILAIGSGLACVQRPGFVCETSDQCTLSGATGTCESTGYCSFPDLDCPGGRRYGQEAPDLYAGQCVSSDADAAIDGEPVDGPDAPMADAGPDSNLVTFIPSNIEPARLTSGTAAIDLVASDCPIEIDSDAGTIRRVSDNANRRPGGVLFASENQGANPSIGVFSATYLTIPAGCEVRVVGVAALAIAVSNDITIDGTILATGGRGSRATPGPGGFVGGIASGSNGSGPGAGLSLNPAPTDLGGGGAGHVGVGGDGGDRATDQGGDGGGSYGVAALEPLVGGSGGAAGADGSGSGGGGGGGGAVQLSARGRILVTGVINAGGGGGGGGSNDNGGGGGGAGGAVLLEAPDVSVLGVIACNGGGGGAGADMVPAGASGETGLASATSAAGGPRSGEGGAGGAGGAGLLPDGLPGENAAGTGADDNPGGGGGGGGRIRLRGTTIVRTGVLSPAAGVTEGSL